MSNQQHTFTEEELNPYKESEFKDFYTLSIDFTDEDYYDGGHTKTLKGDTDINFEFDLNNEHKGIYKLNVEELLKLLKGNARRVTSRSEEAILRYGESHRKVFARFLE